MGVLLLLFVAAAFVQSAREFAMWQAGPAAFGERSIQERQFRFGGHQFVVEDPFGVEPGYSEAERDGMIQPTVDGTPLGPPSRAGIRDHRDNMGRYHTWYDAWVFFDHATGDSALYLARRLQPNPHDTPKFETTIVDAKGSIDRRVYRGAQLSTDFRRFRSSQFLQDGWTAFPLSFMSLFGMPPLLLVYPIAPLILGLVLTLRRPNRKGSRRPAALDQTTA